MYIRETLVFIKIQWLKLAKSRLYSLKRFASFRLTLAQSTL